VFTIVVVLNTSAFSAFKQINCFEILKELFDQQIAIPRGVLEEYSRRFVAKPSFITVKDLTQKQMERARNLDLGQGEKEAIILAQDLEALLIIEDRKARKICEEMGIEKTGTYGIIRVAFEECIITRQQMIEMVEKLKKHLYYRKSLIDWVLAAQKSQKVRE